MDQVTFKVLQDQLREMVDGDTLEAMADIARRVGVLCAIDATKSMDILTLATYLYHEKEQLVPMDTMTRIVTDYLPKVIADGMVSVDGELTPDAQQVVLERNMMLDGVA